MVGTNAIVMCEMVSFDPIFIFDPLVVINNAQHKSHRSLIPDNLECNRLQKTFY